jgi:enoyl-CoA hydratase/carnithine racemase
VTTEGQEPVIMTVAGGVATLSLNRPHRHNAIDDATHDRLLALWGAALADPAVRVIVMRGEGRSFCSGRDTTQLGERVDGETDEAVIRRFQLLRETQLHSPKPVVAALRGATFGAGLELALAADIRIGASDLQLAFPEVGYGLMTDSGGSPLATILAGPSRAKWMVMTGRRVDAQCALAWGLVDEVVEAEHLDATVAALAAELADKSPEVLSMIKATIDDMWSGALRTALRLELVSQLALFAGEDFQARRRARLDAHQRVT